jgi:hypothetical protein
LTAIGLAVGRTSRLNAVIRKHALDEDAAAVVLE